MRQTLCWHGRTTGCLTMSLHTGQCSSCSRLFMLDCGRQRGDKLFKKNVTSESELTKNQPVCKLNLQAELENVSKM